MVFRENSFVNLDKLFGIRSIQLEEFQICDFVIGF
jgi:hypothetical protein